MINGVCVVGFCGPARSGKDTAANYLADYINTLSLAVDVPAEATIFSMAGTLKSMLTHLLQSFGPDDSLGKWEFINECLGGHLKEAPIEGLGKSPRELMQTLGTEWGRQQVHDNLWVLVMRNKIKAFGIRDGSLAPDEWYRVVCIPDIRYDNEASLCDYIWRIERHNAPQVKDHASEAGLSPELVTGVISNNSTLEAFRKKITVIGHTLLESEKDAWRKYHESLSQTERH